MRHKNTAESVRSPTMAGGLFSIDKDFFEFLGTYDSGKEKILVSVSVFG